MLQWILQAILLWGWKRSIRYGLSKMVLLPNVAKSLCFFDSIFCVHSHSCQLGCNFCCLSYSFKVGNNHVTISPPNIDNEMVDVMCGDINYDNASDWCTISLKQMCYRFLGIFELKSRHWLTISSFLFKWNGNEMVFDQENIRSNFFMWQFHLWFPSEKSKMTGARGLSARAPF